MEDAGRFKMKKETTIISIILILAIILSLSQTKLTGNATDPLTYECSESDNGIDFENKGVTESSNAYSGVRKRDECVDLPYSESKASAKLMEYYCSDEQRVASNKTRCLCKNGACIIAKRTCQEVPQNIKEKILDLRKNGYKVITEEGDYVKKGDFVVLANPKDKDLN